ncbi:MAG: hypothetical protein LBI82_01255 [Dysgonamonadaceae bacterium]|jgi:hypothetical protein|nr:hypothetical protein [Dysgonamonadaceae bacterium]
MKRFLFLFFGFFGSWCFFMLFVEPLVTYLYSGKLNSSLYLTGDDAAMATSLAKEFLWCIIASVVLTIFILREEKKKQRKKEETQAIKQ